MNTLKQGFFVNPTDHPSHYHLSAFLSGLLDDKRQSEVESHLVECRICNDMLDSHSLQDDPFIDALRRNSGTSVVSTDDKSTLSDTNNLDDTSSQVRNLSTRYQINDEIACGGMGVIYRARDLDLQRDLAVKVLRDEYANIPEFERRFRNEAHLAGRLQHPGVAPTYEFGYLSNGQPFIAMKLVEGHTFAELLSKRNDETESRMRLLATFEQICHTMAYAHSHGVIHRDLKPNNIMVGSFGEIQVMDWGLAKEMLGTTDSQDLNESPSTDLDTDPEYNSSDKATDALTMTRFGTVMGTPAYMAPEQARGEWDLVDQRSDVFSLGAMLCEILTGEPLFGHSANAKMISAVAEGNTSDAKKRLEHCGADRELVDLCNRCLTSEIDHRPLDAKAVAQEISQYRASVENRLREAELNSERQSARVEEEQKRRHITIALAIVVLVFLVAIGSSSIWYILHQSRLEAKRQNQIAKTERNIAGTILEASLLAEEGWANVDDTGQWEATIKSAKAAVERAQKEFDETTLPIDRQMNGQIHSLSNQLESQDDDRKFVAAIRRIQIEKSNVDVESSRFAYAGALLGYRNVFFEHGLPPQKISPQDAAKLLQTKHTEVRRVAVEALNDAVILSEHESAEQRWLQQVVLAVDDDPWRTTVREAIKKRDRVALKKIAEKLDVSSKSPEDILLLSSALNSNGERVNAISLLHRAQRSHPSEFWINQSLASLMAIEGDSAKAVEFYRAALALQPRNAGVLINLATQLVNLNRTDEAITLYRKAIQIEPDYAVAHNNLGLALKKKGLMDEAIASLRKSIKLDAEFADGYWNLGATLSEAGHIDESLIICQKATELAPKSAIAHYNLGNSFRLNHQIEEAQTAYRKAIKLKPGYAQAHINLGMILRSTGKFSESLAQYKTGHEIGSKQKQWRYPSANWVKQAKRFVELDAQLPKILAGDVRVATDIECIELANLCYLKNQFVTAVRFYDQVAENQTNGESNLKGGIRYRAGCVAVLAGTGQGIESEITDDVSRTEMRRKAIRWLNQELTARTNLNEKITDKQREAIRKATSKWLDEKDLSHVRDAKNLEDLPAKEGDDWQSFWKNVRDFVNST